MRVCGNSTPDCAFEGRGLLCAAGKPVDVLPQVVDEAQADRVLAEEDYTPYARRRDRLVSQALDLGLMPGLAVHPPNAVTKSDVSPYIVYTPYAHAWKRLLPERRAVLSAPEHIEMQAALPSEELPELRGAEDFPAGEAEAHRRLEEFARQRIYRYAQDRDRMAVDGTSALSPYLRFGMLSMRAAVNAAVQALVAADHEQARQSAEVWLNELIWCEFYEQIMFHHPAVHRSAFRQDLSRVGWRNDRSEFEAWKAGSDRRPDRRRGNAATVEDRLDAQQGAHDHGFVPGEGFADRLALGRKVVHGQSDRWRSEFQQWGLAVDCRNGNRRGAVFPDLQPGSAKPEVRS